jgi:hypothetical protein
MSSLYEPSRSNPSGATSAGMSIREDNAHARCISRGRGVFFFVVGRASP